LATIVPSALISPLAAKGAPPHGSVPDFRFAGTPHPVSCNFPPFTDSSSPSSTIAVPQITVLAVHPDPSLIAVKLSPIEPDGSDENASTPPVLVHKAGTKVVSPFELTYDVSPATTPESFTAHGLIHGYEPLPEPQVEHQGGIWTVDAVVVLTRSSVDPMLTTAK